MLIKFMKRLSFVLLLMALTGLVSCDQEWDDSADSTVLPHSSTTETTDEREKVLQELLAKYPNTAYAELMAEAAKVTYYRGKSVAYFGASLVNLPECALARYVVEKALGCHITNYGHGGYGYAAPNNLQGYARNMGQHDIYIFWGTTNDYSLNVPVGQPTDYTEEDGYDVTKLKTACGGMNYAIAQARRINPDALLLGYSTVKMFNGVRLDGSLRTSKHTNKVGAHFYDYVDAQLACFKRADIPCLNVWDWDFFTHGNWSEYYMADGTHMQHGGYFFLSMQHLKFLIKMAKDDHVTGIEDIVM